MSEFEPEVNVGLARLTTIGTGGPARWFARPRTLAALQAALQWARAGEVAVEVVGLGSNVLVHDDGVEALVLRLEGELAAIEIAGSILSAGGGATNAVCLHRARDADLGGFEFASAIPGTVGGGTRMNAGAYGREWSDVLIDVTVVDAYGSRTVTPGELGLAYRHSDLRAGEVVAHARFGLEPRPAGEVKSHVAELLAQRKATQPTNRRTFGSVFKNPAHELGAGRMLEDCGLKGYAIGGARVSPVHANFIENTGAATSADAIALMVEARSRVHERFGVVLEHEVRFLGPLRL
jgi:UDP-N-acetylenolpyruvoylglucosamine reductase